MQLEKFEIQESNLDASLLSCNLSTSVLTSSWISFRSEMKVLPPTIPESWDVMKERKKKEMGKIPLHIPLWVEEKTV